MYEVAYYGDDPAAGLVSLGICAQNSTLSAACGEDANSYGYRAADGGIYSNNAAIIAPASAPASRAKTYIQVVLDLGANKLTFYSNGGTIGSVTVSAATGGRMYYPALSIGTVKAYGLSMFVNFGQRAFAYPIPGAEGWYTVRNPPSPLYLGPVGEPAYSSAATDTPANQNYDQALLNADDLAIEKSATCWLWNGRSDSATYAPIDVDNRFRKYSQLLDQDYRDASVFYRALERFDGTLASVSHTVGTAYIDRVEEVSEDLIRIYPKSKLDTLKLPLQRRFFPPFADAGIAGRPVPIIIGAARSVDVGAFLVSEADRTFQLSDAAIANIGVMRDKGNPLDANATPSQYVPTNDLQGVVLDTMPQGALTGDVSTAGTQGTYPGQPDVLNGHGSDWDTTWTGPTAPPPGGWVFTNTDSPTYTSTATKTVASSHNMLTLTSNRPITAIGGGREFSHKIPAILRPGKTYKISFTMWDFQSTAPGGGLVVLSAFGPYTNSDIWISPRATPLVGGFHSDQPFVLVYKVPAGATRDLIFSVVGALGSSPTVCTIRNIIVQELAEAIVDVPLIGSTFGNYMDVVLGRHAGLASSEWSASDLAALDAAYPGGPLGAQIASPVTIDGAARLPMDSVCGTLQDDRFGVIRFRRLVNPNTTGVPSLATYTEDDLDYPVIHSVDYAPGLTTTVGDKRNWRQLSDNDFVTDYALVPAALRTQLKRKSRIEQVCNVQLQGMYRFAELSSTLDTIFDSDEMALAEMTRVCMPYSINYARAPRFVYFTINYAGIPPEYLFGDVITISYQSGQVKGVVVQERVAIVSTTLQLGKQKLTCVGWTTG